MIAGCCNFFSLFSLSSALLNLSFLTQALLVTLPLTFLPLTLNLFIGFSSLQPSLSLCNSILRLFSWPQLPALLAISSDLSLGKSAVRGPTLKTPQRIGGERCRRKGQVWDEFLRYIWVILFRISVAVLWVCSVTSSCRVYIWVLS